jgi:hypothetical protein
MATTPEPATASAPAPQGTPSAPTPVPQQNELNSFATALGTLRTVSPWSHKPDGRPIQPTANNPNSAAGPPPTWP